MDQRLLVYLDKICHSQSIATLWDIHCGAMQDFGFDRLIYAFSHFMTPNSFGPREDFLILYSHPAEYMQRIYQDGQLYEHSPMIEWAAHNYGACSWGWVQQNLSRLSPEARHVLEINSELGVTAGYTISFPETSSCARGVMALTARPGLSQQDVDQIWTQHGRTIEAMNHVAHLKIMSLPQQTDRAKLSARQREALEWVGNGKTNQDIATIMGVSPATVEKHLRIARAKLGVETTAQAILKISYLNQIRSPYG
ncbi:LuxR family transcriptional regulator [Aliiroseovarius sediminis]|uniref:helix-turn-helix transcriptional regulator n=1 Tax=Aliiroseovarius sediminis TaxID=2925839 RepID=UPI001F5A6D6B|nr:LuxR family transcriptional regulator [Aliiroseovarius sediminis]MCI2393725.1 LuxR family transcriptional regulator [Aliiroseovarius sediminis]